MKSSGGIPLERVLARVFYIRSFFPSDSLPPFGDPTWIPFFRPACEHIGHRKFIGPRVGVTGRDTHKRRLLCHQSVSSGRVLGPLPRPADIMGFHDFYINGRDNRDRGHSFFAVSLSSPLLHLLLSVFICVHLRKTLKLFAFFSADHLSHQIRNAHLCHSRIVVSHVGHCVQLPVERYVECFGFSFCCFKKCVAALKAVCALRHRLRRASQFGVVHIYIISSQEYYDPLVQGPFQIRDSQTRFSQSIG